MRSGESNARRVGVAVITHNSRRHLEVSLPRLLRSTIAIDVLVVNSSSKDGTVELARELGAATLVVPRSGFNHGHTRELARRELGGDIVVMMTPDAYVCSAETIGTLVDPLLAGRAAAAYGRQVSGEGAGLVDRLMRAFNYPAESQIRGIDDVCNYGAYVFYSSDAFAAYSNDALDEIGGFAPTLVSEDVIATAKLLRAGYRVAYVAEAVVEHTHDHSLLDEFRRYFDTGLVRAKHRDLLEWAGSEDVRGREFALAALRTSLRTSPAAAADVAAHLAAKWLGFKIGCLGARLPMKMKSRLSAQDFYWTSEYAS